MISPAAVRLFAVGAGILAAGCGSGGGAGIGSPSEVTLIDVQTQVFSPRCALSGCHVGTDAPHGLDLSAGAASGNLVGVSSAEVPSLLRVEPFNASGSYLYLKLIGDPQILGDPMPLEGSALNAGQLNLIETWIDQGAM